MADFRPESGINTLRCAALSAVHDDNKRRKRRHKPHNYNGPEDEGRLTSPCRVFFFFLLSVAIYWSRGNSSGPSLVLTDLGWSINCRRSFPDAVRCIGEERGAFPLEVAAAGWGSGAGAAGFFITEQRLQRRAGELSMHTVYNTGLSGLGQRGRTSDGVRGGGGGAS